MADLNGDGFWSSEIDFDYEFDVCRFFDFTRPESDADAYEAERWFHSAPSYPPSRLKQPNRTKFTVKAETKCTVKTIKPRSSTLLKPTESHLAKQKKARDLNSSRKGRLQNPSSSTMNEKSLQKSPVYEIEATKRQKLDIGYLRNVAHLKHQNSMLHKIVKKVGQLEGSSIYSRSRVTVPREPDLETAQRAQRRSFKSKIVPDSTQRARPNTHGFKARPLNRKILQAPSLPLPKKSMPPVPEFQVFHLKTTERALQHQSANILKAHNRNSALQRVHVSKACHLEKPTHFGTKAFIKDSQDDVAKLNMVTQDTKDFTNEIKQCLATTAIHTDDIIFQSIEDESLIQNRLAQDPPTELFNKGSKENVATSFQRESLRCWGKCGNGRRIPEVERQPNININRSVGIR